MPVENNDSLRAQRWFIDVCGPKTTIPEHINYYPTFPGVYGVIILSYALAVAVFYSALLVALYRLAKSNPTFIIFLSHGINDTALLFTGNYFFLEELINIRFFSSCERIRIIIINSLLYSTNLHLLLIAANRGCSMHFPLLYAIIWTRRTCLLAVALCWTLTALCNAIVIVGWLMHRNLEWLYKLSFILHHSVYVSMTIYASVIFRKALERLFCCYRGVGEEDGHHPASTPAHSSLEQSARIRLFIYAFVTSMPFLINQYVIPRQRTNTLRFIWALNMISISLLSSALLFAMSTMVRKSTPLFGRLCSTPTNTVAVIATTSASAGTRHG